MLDSQSRRTRLVPFVVFLLSAAAATTGIWHSDQHDRQEQRTRVFNLAGEHADNLQRSIERGLSATYALAALVRQGKGTVPNFDEVAGQMLPFYPGVSEIGLAPGGIIRNVAPLTGNEKAVGHNLLQDPAQNKEAYLARDTGKLTLAGPLNLVQGGPGAIGRLPVFLDDADGKPVFWGFTFAMIRFPEALETVNLPRLAEQGFAYELWRIHPDTGQKQIIAASSAAALIESVGRTLQVPNAIWTLSVAPLGGWGNPPVLAFEAALGLLFSLLLAYVAKILLELRMHKLGLEALVRERTAEARAREADLNHAQSVARVGSWVLDFATKELRGSAEASRILGASGSGPINYKSFLRLVHPDDRKAVDLASRASLKGEPYDIEYRILAGGSIRWVHSNADLAFDADGKLSHALGTVQDITERKRAEEALRASEEKFAKAFRSSPMFICISTIAEGRHIEVNEAYQRVTGHTRGEVIGHTADEIALWKNPQDRQRAIDSLLKNGRISGFEAQMRKKSGESMVCEIWAESIVIEERPCAIWVTNDVTARKKAEAEIHRINAELERRVAERTQALEVANNELEAFSYSVSHDLRAPLRSIHGFSRLLEKQYASQIDEQGRDMLRRVGAGAEKMGLLIDDLLMLSRLSRKEMRIGAVDLSALSREVAKELQEAEPARRAEWVIAPQVSAEGDPGLLRVVLQNLIGNAWKYSSRRSHARIEFGVTEKDGRPAYFVRDDGAGFDMTYAAKLFGAFQRLHSAAEFPGNGIGLATVARIIHRHGGTAWAEGRVGEGATFYFSLG